MRRIEDFYLSSIRFLFVSFFYYYCFCVFNYGCTFGGSCFTVNFCFVNRMDLYCEV